MSDSSLQNLKELILQSLSQIHDPDLNKDIVSLGFVKNLLLKETLLGVDVSVDIELTTPACPVKDQFRQQAEENLKSISGLRNIKVSMTSRTVGLKSAKGIPGVSNILVVGSGKGGVGKSTVSVNLALGLKHLGAKVGLLDADIYGPSLAMMMGIQSNPEVKNGKIIPIQSHNIPVMSFAFFAPIGEAVIWRGATVAKAVEQMCFEVDWGPLDYLIVDLPPGTGDVPLTLTHAVDIAGAVLVSSPQQVALLDALRGLSFFEKMKIPLLGIVENMSGGIFGQGHVRQKAEQRGLPFLGTIPLSAEIPPSGDQGLPLLVEHPDHPVSQVFLKMASQIASRVSQIHFQRGDS
jgi:ATP-binding protein involved in chromosome partitioning